MKSKKKIFLQAVCAAALIVSCLIFTQQKEISAAEAGRTGSIHLYYSPAEGTKFSVYRAGDITENWEFVLTGAFQDIPADLNDLDTEKMTKLAGTLGDFAEANHTEPDFVKPTDADGEVLFENLEKGVYLVIGESVIRDGVKYDPVPFLLTVPSLNDEGEWVYQAEAEVKYETSVPTGEEVEYKVTKHWADSGNDKKRPSAVTVDILKNGELYTTQTLSAENNWSYSWKAEDDGSVWTVVEREIPDGYTVLIEKNQTSFIVTNTYSGELPDIPKTGDSSSLPLLPAVMLALSGTALVAFAVIRNNRKDED